MALFMLLIAFGAIAFGAGLLAARWAFNEPVRVASPGASSPARATPVPPTPTSAPTPTPAGRERGEVLETVTIEVAPDDFRRIEAKREEALARWVLLAGDDDFVPATVRLGRGEALPAEIRLKGDWADHFVGDKWSFRVEMAGDGYLDGMGVFSLQDPSTRTYLNEWLFMKALRAEGLLSVRYRFVHLVLNGVYKGIYALEEGFSRELLESQERREGLIIRYDENLLWEYRAAYENDEVVPWGVDRFHLIDEFQSGRVGRDPALAAQRDVAVGMLRALDRGTRPASQVFDVEAMGRFLALCDVWEARHALLWHNLRFYYNPVTTRLEPVAFDTQPLGGGDPVEIEQLDGLRFALATEDSKLQRAYVRALHAYSRPAYLDALRDRWAEDHARLRAALEAEFAPEVLAPPWDALAARRHALDELLHPIQTTYAYARSVTSETLEIDVGNLLGFPVEIVDVATEEAAIPAEAGWVGASANAVVSPTVDGGAPVLDPLAPEAALLEYVTLSIPLDENVGPMFVKGSDAEDGPVLSDVHLTTRLWGMTRTVTQPVLSAYSPPLPAGPRPAYPSLQEALARHPALRPVAGERALTFDPGVWEIAGDLVLPAGYGLRLEAGTELVFEPDRYLLASGPLDFTGDAAQPVVLRPGTGYWQGIIVLNAEVPSSWRHVTVSNTIALDREGWSLTGGITFYRSPLVMDHGFIVGSQAEDGLNVIESWFDFTASAFSDTASDAFDADFSRGRIERCAFHRIAADGIDVSGSEVVVRDAVFDTLGDKALSVGEASQLTGSDLWIDNVMFGVVSKDLSRVTVERVRLGNVARAGLAAYVKKPAYGPAAITASDVEFADVPEARWTLVQTGSWIDLEGVRIWGTDVDVDALYAPLTE
jgi:hypothetical protein